MEGAANEGDQARAAIALIDRACGKPAQSVNSTVTRIDPDSISDAELASYGLSLLGHTGQPSTEHCATASPCRSLNSSES
jgi:hypothetical protein